MVDKHSQLHNTLDVLDVAIDESGMIKREHPMSSTMCLSLTDQIRTYTHFLQRSLKQTNKKNSSLQIQFKF